jgi:group I intron endonuclease
LEAFNGCLVALVDVRPPIIINNDRPSNLKMNGKIYCAHCVVTGKKYIGKTKQELEKRIKQHYKDRNRLNYLFYRAINKHGWDNFIWGLVENCDISIINQREEYWISFYKTNQSQYGYNMSSGGEFGISREVLVECGKRNGAYARDNKIGVFSLTKEEKSKIGKIGGSKAKEMGVGIHAHTSDQKSENGRMGGLIRAEQTARYFEILSPTGELHTGKNMTNFCRKNNLTPSAVCNVLNGKVKHHKGWTRP